MTPIELQRAIISIHAPARGATRSTSVSIKGCPRISIHAPARGATVGKSKYFFHVYISIHAPARGATLYILADFMTQLNFNPRSREGSDSLIRECTSVFSNFNPRSREGSDSGGSQHLLPPCLFQSTLPRGERHKQPCRDGSRGRFQSTLPRGERRCAMFYSLNVQAFQSTLPRGERRRSS